MIKRKGFTIIEMLIVITLFVILLPTIMAIISTILRQQLRLYRMVEVKRQGDAALSFMKGRILREGIVVIDNSDDKKCDQATEAYTSLSSGSDFIFLLSDDVNGPEYHFEQSGTNINYVTTSPVPITTALTSNTVQVSNFQISCFRRTIQTNNPIMIQISFTVTSVGTTTNISLPYKTKVRLLSSSP